MKKFIIAAFCLVLALLFAACAAEDTPEGERDDSAISYTVPAGYTEASEEDYAEYWGGSPAEYKIRMYYADDYKKVLLVIHEGAATNCLEEKYGENCDNEWAKETGARKMTIGNVGGVLYDNGGGMEHNFDFMTQGEVWTISGDNEEDVIALAETVSIN